MSEVEYQNISKELSDIAFEFLRCLYGDDVERYWSMISKVDKARVYGMYLAIRELSEDSDQSFMEYVRTKFQLVNRELFEKFKENPGIATHMRYTDEGDILLLIINDVQVPRFYIAETQVEACPLVITLDTEINSGEFSTEYKVRLYNDKLYDELT